MAETTKISWTDATINFWHGCKKVSEGCKYCYMYRDKDRYGQDPTTVIKAKETYILSNLKKLTEPSKIFTCSWSDFFIPEADEWRPWAWDIIKKHPQHQWQILTKRPERIENCLPEDWDDGYPNVWLGISAENGDAYNERWPQLASYNAPLTAQSGIQFLSLEPLLEPIELDYNFELKMFDWVIVGGESGNETGKYRFRPCELEWIEDIVKQCKEAGVPVFVKQLGTHLAKKLELKDRHGADLSEFPESVRFQEFPEFQVV